MSFTETTLPEELFSTEEYLEELIEGQSRILDMVSEGRELPELLNEIVLWSETKSRTEMLGSILLLDETGEHLLHGAAPSLPPEYNRAIHGIAIGPSVGSCGTAAYTKQRVIVADIETDPLWAVFRELASQFNLKACWSTPFIDRRGNVVATFAMYYREPRKPSEHDLLLIRWISRTTLLAIEWRRSEQDKEQLMAVRQKFYDTVRREREDFYHLLMQTPALVAFLKGPDHVFELANDLYLKAARRGPDIIGKPAREVLPELEEQGFFGLLDNAYQTGEPVIGKEALVKVTMEDGQLNDLYLNFIYLPVKNKEGVPEGIYFHGVDVTELVLAKQEASESHKKLQAIIEATPECIKIVSQEGILDFMNHAGLQMIEGDSSLLTKACVYDVVAPEYRDEWIENHHRVCAGEGLSWEFDIIGLKGTRRRMETHAVPLPGLQGNLQLAVTRDVTERKKMEEALRQSEAQLRKKVEERTAELAAKNKELERSNRNLQEFAYAASHDLKEPIRKVHLFSARLKDSLAGRINETETGYFEKMELASRRMGHLIDDLLNYAQVSLGSGAAEEVDLDKVVGDVLSDLDLQIEESGATFSVDKLFTLKGNCRQLQQAFLNLIGNAIKYRKPGLAPEISIRYQQVEATAAKVNLPAGEQQAFHQITVKDNGIGFAQKDAERIFQVFTRLHGNSEYKGTGVGLSIVQRVVENHNGHIVAESKPGEGATFTIYFPVD